MSILSNGIKKRVLDVLGFFALGAWLAFIYMRFSYYQEIAPTKYDASTGHIYQVNNHGYYFYLDKTQNFRTYYPLVVGASFVAIALFLERRWKIYKDIYDFRARLAKFKAGPR